MGNKQSSSAGAEKEVFQLETIKQTGTDDVLETSSEDDLMGIGKALAQGDTKESYDSKTVVDIMNRKKSRVRRRVNLEDEFEEQKAQESVGTSPEGTIEVDNDEVGKSRGDSAVDIDSVSNIDSMPAKPSTSIFSLFCTCGDPNVYVDDENNEKRSITKKKKSNELNIHNKDVVSFKLHLTPEEWSEVVTCGFNTEEVVEDAQLLVKIIKHRPYAVFKRDWKRFTGENIQQIEELKSHPKSLFKQYHVVDELWDIVEMRMAIRKSDNVAVLIKIIKEYSKHKQQIQREIDVVNSMTEECFSHILQILLYNDEIWIVQEYCNAANLNEFLTVDVMNEEEIGYVTNEIVKGLHLLHEKGLVKRDLSSDNVLIDKDGFVMLSDMDVVLDDLSRRSFTPPEHIVSETRIITVQSPADVWSLGNLILEMCNGVTPYSSLRPLREYYNIMKGEKELLDKEELWSDDLVDFVHRCLESNPDKRWTCLQLQSHPFLNNVITKQQFSAILSSRLSHFR